MNTQQESLIRTDANDEPIGAMTSARSEVSDADATQIAHAVSLGVAAQFPWVGPLLEAALLSPSGRAPVEIMTKWGGFPSTVQAPADADEERHRIYVRHILTVFDQVCPWLMPLLNACKATLLVYPGECRYTVQPDPAWGRPACAYEIPHLIPLTHLTPFPAEDGDPIH